MKPSRRPEPVGTRRDRTSWLRSWQEPALYGGFIHPWSSSAANDLHLLVSKWTCNAQNQSTAYHVSQFVGTV